MFEGGRFLRFPLNEQETAPVVPGKFTAFNKSAAIGQKKKEEITHEKKVCMHMEIEITTSDLTLRKLFSFTDSTIVEA